MMDRQDLGPWQPRLRPSKLLAFFHHEPVTTPAAVAMLSPLVAGLPASATLLFQLRGITHDVRASTFRDGSRERVAG